jgi:integrase
MATKLTKTMIEKIQPGDRDVFLWDDAIPGFGARVFKSGKISFVVQYRNRERRSRRVTLGRFGVLTLQQARQRAIRLLAQVSDGGDPAEERREVAQEPTFSDLAERYIADYAKPRKKAGSIREDERIIEKHLGPALGTRRVSHITHGDIDRLHAALSATPYMANRVAALASTVFGCAEKWGLIPPGSNPAKGISRFRESSRERFLSMDELERLGATMRAMEAAGSISSFVAAGIRLLALTGCRRNEIRFLRWEEVDLEHRELRLRDSKTGPRSVPLNAAAVQVIDGLERRNDWVFPGQRGDSAPVCFNSAWERIRERAGLRGVRTHDLRHSFASVGASSGMSLLKIGRLLGHVEAKTTAKYAHLGRDPIHEASEEIASKIAAAMDGAKCAEVMELAAR